MPNRRGTPPSPPADGNDYAVDAEDIADLLDEPARVVAHSYGCIGALLAVRRRPAEVLSLTVVEPPVFQLAASDPEVRAAVDAFRELCQLPTLEAFIAGFQATYLGAASGPAVLAADMRQLVRLTINERPPWTADLPLAAIRDAAVPVLVVSGGQSIIFERCADALARELGPVVERIVLPGAGHAVQRLGEPFNILVERHFKSDGPAFASPAGNFARRSLHDFVELPFPGGS